MRGILTRGAPTAALIALIGTVLFSTHATAKNSRAETAWVGSWATANSVPAIFDAPLTPIDGQTIRQIVRLSVGGRAVRVRVSNFYGSAELDIGGATVAVSDGLTRIDSNTLRTLTFDGNPAVTLAPGERRWSDPVDLSTGDLTQLAISLYLPPGAADPGSPVTHHVRGLQTNYLLAGNQSAAADPAWTDTVTAWYYISAVDVLARKTTRVLALLGDSITDGDQSTAGANNRYPDQLAERLLQGNGPDGRRGGRRTAILNVGISGNQMVLPLIGDSVVNRFQRDVVEQSGITHVLLLAGINDIGLQGLLPFLPTVTTDDIIAAYQDVIAQAHAAGLKIVGATLTPSAGFFLPDYNQPIGEAKRQVLNAWIRTSGAFDDVVDFDAVIRDPDNPAFMHADLSADGLHPNDAGYEAMAQAISKRILAND